MRRWRRETGVQQKKKEGQVLSIPQIHLDPQAGTSELKLPSTYVHRGAGAFQEKA